MITNIKRMDNIILGFGVCISLMIMQVTKTQYYSGPFLDFEVVSHFLATVAGAYGNLVLNWKEKTRKELFINATANISIGYILGGFLFEYLAPVSEFKQIGCFAIGGFSALLVVIGYNNILTKLQNSSWQIFKNYTKIDDKAKKDTD